ncbi:hypothetical protein M9Y10_043553 [Tritrichomonas musculus]|uniref:Uncharacterized protein n=1 Tax=Tritrichomonas musculus TaxID=1915356 RepID=A0ABR2K0N8_9EUKA
MLTLNKDPQWAVVEEDQKIMSVQMSSDNQYIAAGVSNGILSLRSPQTGRLSYSLVHSEQRYPVTAVRFSQADPKVIISASADGIIKEWTTKNPQSVWETSEPGNQIFALDMSKDGTIFCTGGSDTHLRVYDYAEKKIKIELMRNEFDLESTRGHTNRICSVHCHPSDTNIIFTGGWDNTIQIWDIRQPFPARSIFGPHIAGDSLDTCDRFLMAGSWREKDQFLIWDIRTYQLIATMQWSSTPEDHQCSIYTAKFHPNCQFIVGAGSGANQVKTYSTSNFSSIGSPLQMKSAVLTMCLDPMADSVIIGTSGGDLCLHNFVTSGEI